jgi:site-specific recombinase XerD
MQRMENGTGLRGSAGLMLVDGVTYLDPETSVFEAMLSGWDRQQSVRAVNPRVISDRIKFVRRVARVSNQYPWQWTSAEIETFFTDLSSGGRPLAMSTMRGYECVLRLFLGYVTDPRYGWPLVCEQRFGSAPQMVLHEFNSIRHVADAECRPGRRPLSYDEVQALFDAADGLVEKIRARGRKGCITAMRNALVLKVVYAFGLRRREAWGLDLPDFRTNPHVPRFGTYGGVFVRWGKASNGSPPKPRTVLLVPEMDWILEPLQQWLEEVRPMLIRRSQPALLITERGTRLARRGVSEAFQVAKEAAGLDSELDLHCLRHSYVTHLVEFGYPPRFVQEQVGHRHTSTTAIYTGVSDDYRNRLMQKAVASWAPELWES